MPDDARTPCFGTVAMEDIVAYCYRNGIDPLLPHVRHVVDALLAAGWAPPPATSSAAPEGAALPGTEGPVAAQDTAPPPAPASDDVKARATAVLRGEDARWRPGVNKYPDRIVEALAAAGILAAPSHLDCLAAWAQESGGAFGVDRIEIGGESLYVAWVEDTSYQRDAETATDPQEAARRVLARLEES